MSRVFVFSDGSANRGLPTYAGKVLCVLIAVAFGSSLAPAAPVPYLQIDNWDNPFPGTITTGTSPGASISQSNSPITSGAYFGTVSRTATVINGSSGTSSATIVPNVLNFILTPGGTLTLDYQFSSPSVSFEQLLLSGFFANRSSIPYTVDVSYELFGQNTWNYSGTLTIPGNEPVLEQYTLPLGSGNGFLGGLQILYRNPSLVLDIDGSLCGFSAVPEIDPATGGSALSLVAGALAMIEQRRRRRSGSTTMA